MAGSARHGMCNQRKDGCVCTLPVGHPVAQHRCLCKKIWVKPESTSK